MKQQNYRSLFTNLITDYKKNKIKYVKNLCQLSEMINIVNLNPKFVNKVKEFTKENNYHDSLTINKGHDEALIGFNFIDDKVDVYFTEKDMCNDLNRNGIINQSHLDDLDINHFENVIRDMIDIVDILNTRPNKLNFSTSDNIL